VAPQKLDSSNLIEAGFCFSSHIFSVD
jgi:hypothetical protein